MQVFEAFLNKKWQTVVWHRECEESRHVQQPRGLGLGGSLGGQDISLKAKAWGVKAKAKAKTLSSKAKAKAKTFMRCPQGQDQPRGQQDCVDVTRSSVQLSDNGNVSAFGSHFRWRGDCGSAPGRITFESWSNGPDPGDVRSIPTSLGLAWISGTTGALT